MCAITAVNVFSGQKTKLSSETNPKPVSDE
jgi:hypothetical protein